MVVYLSISLSESYHFFKPRQIDKHFKKILLLFAILLLIVEPNSHPSPVILMVSSDFIYLIRECFSP